MTAWKRAVARAFDRADAYEDAARIQAIVAEGLAAAVAAEPLPPSPRTLEIGCGTGLLTRALRNRLDLGSMLVTDLAPAMLARCRTRLGDGEGVAFAVMDGERPAARPVFDLVASSLVAQWFVDLEGTLGRLAGLLRPAGLLAVTTLAEGTFAEWMRAQGRADTALYPSLATLNGMRFAGCTTEIRAEPLRESHADGAAFLRALRAIGAGTPAATAPVRSAAALRQVLRAFDAQGASITYVVATCLIRRTGQSVG